MVKEIEPTHELPVGILINEIILKYGKLMKVSAMTLGGNQAKFL